MRVWIEIEFWKGYQGGTLVTLHVRVWIEIKFKFAVSCTNESPST